MKSITFLLARVLGWTVLPGVLVVVVGLQTPVIEDALRPQARTGGELRIAGIPPPQSAVFLVEPSNPYTVGSDRLLVITGLGNSADHTPTFLMIDDVVVWYSGALSSPDGHRVPPPGIVARSGAVVRILGFGTGRATGHLIEEDGAENTRPRLLSLNHTVPLPPIEERVAGIPDPRDALLLLEEDPAYVVPNGKRLVVTGLGANTNGRTILVIGQMVAWNNSLSGTLGDYEIPSPGIVVPSGASVDVVGNNQDSGRAIGYLIDA